MMSHTETDIAELYMEQYRQRPYTYGVTVIFGQDKQVVIDAPLVPAGKVLYAWHSTTSYQRIRTEPSLPLLAEGYSYRIDADMDSEPEGTALLRIVFKDRRENVVGIHAVDGTEDTFIYPKGAYSYSIELLQGGFRRTTFRKILLKRVTDIHTDRTE